MEIQYSLLALESVYILDFKLLKHVGLAGVCRDGDNVVGIIPCLRRTIQLTGGIDFFDISDGVPITSNGFSL